MTSRRSGGNRARLAVALVLAALTAACSSTPSPQAGASQPAAASSPTASSATPSASPSPTPSVTATARPSVSPRPTPRRTVAPVTFRFPVPVSVGNATQVITVKARGSYATVTAWQLTGRTWHAVLSTTAARVGSNGVVPGSQRHQNTDTTPAGTYTLTQAFGINANPGAHLPYHQVTSQDWWVEDNLSAYYNQMRTAAQGGFDMTAPESSVNGSEHLITHTVQYQYAVVIDFNRWPAVRYRGAGIFLHVNGSGSTAGCVSVPLSTMVALLRWLSPVGHPRIAIA